MLEGHFAIVSHKRMIFKRKGVVMLWIYVVFECVLMVNGYPQQSNKGIKHHQNLILRSLSICDLNPLLHARVFYHGAVDQFTTMSRMKSFKTKNSASLQCRHVIWNTSSLSCDSFWHGLHGMCFLKMNGRWLWPVGIPCCLQFEQSFYA